MKLSRRAATTSRPVVTHSIWEEIRTQYMYQISYLVQVRNDPDVLILNADQTPSKYVAASKVTVAEQGTKHIPVSCNNTYRNPKFKWCHATIAGYLSR